MQNTAIGNLAAGGLYKLATGSGNVMVGYNSGGTCENGSNNTFLGANTQLELGNTYISGSIALGEGATTSENNQLMIASNVTSFNISGLTASMGTGEGTILEFDSSGNIIPVPVGNFDSISKISTAITTLQDELIIEGTNLSVGEAWSDMSSVNYNMGVGVGALGTNCTSASECMAVSYNAMNSVTTGGKNAAIGSQCLPNITEGFNSIGLGFWAG